MLKLLFKEVFKSPGKLLALCLVVYLASKSFFVGLFLFVLAAGWLKKTLATKAKALEAAEAEAARELADKAREQAEAQKRAEAAKAQAANAQANAATAAKPVPIRQYAKSAVVIPFKKTGTD